MTIIDLFHRDVTTCTPRDTLELAAGLMWRRGVGCLPVVDEENHVVGMLTDRDIAMAAFLQGCALHSIVVGSVMSKEPLTCTAVATVDDVLRAMAKRHVHRVPVVDTHDHLLGIISLDDIAQRVREGAQINRASGSP
jgi:CBS domain-containing protein